ncbi:related to ALG7 -UDP-N-acetylglucosamine-1-phosphate transferase [Melanopsichium pennsylvanicum]|uniref:UDP-N-acetylglucosamine--dolichyl-phosphate N-acetylglucosaminephosphotransferase n=1 Tax=Melanopsichium pennsylvanicum TaxID=63383 RepID=A0AAJ5C607_9BASI|nr:related to ALG7 -UDP-N-acetylglucosamine-1-phosphate transferase [Melanopsichium pennsylvanicum]
MTWLITAAIVLPFGTVALLLPPLLQLEASGLSYINGPPVWPPFASISNYLLGSTPQRLTAFLDYALSESQREAVLYYDNAFPGLFAAFGLSCIGYHVTSLAISETKSVFLARGFKGRDLLKSIPDPIPESLGLPTAAVYMALLFLFIPFRYFSSSLPGVSKLGNDWEGRMDGRGGFPHHELASFLSALLSFSCAIVLGFLDDVFDIRWRYKLPIPVISSIPLLMVYYAGGGGTSVVVPGWPTFLRTSIGSNIVELGPLYYLYMSLLSTFCTNSINILAGINGVEVGQALIISISLCLNSALYLDPRAGQPGSFASKELLRRHLLSLYLLLPLTAVCMALFKWNRYPAKVFVGDTFCYFAGIVFSTVGILGHFSKTVSLFFVPQIFNFVLSCPQLFGLVPNPRHRVPRFDAKSGCLYPSIQYFAGGNEDEDAKLPNTSKKPLRRASLMATLVLKFLSNLHLVQIEFWDPKDRRKVKSTTNLTILNAILVFRGVQHRSEREANQEKDDHDQRPFTGPEITEWGLWVNTMVLQIMGSAVAFGIRYWVARVVFP